MVCAALAGSTAIAPCMQLCGCNWRQPSQLHAYIYTIYLNNDNTNDVVAHNDKEAGKKKKTNKR